VVVDVIDFEWQKKIKNTPKPVMNFFDAYLLCSVVVEAVDSFRKGTTPSQYVEINSEEEARGWLDESLNHLNNMFEALRVYALMYEQKVDDISPDIELAYTETMGMITQQKLALG
jgi:DNA-dependent RNA polymerase auxiliary subunit epsilon